MWEKAAEAFKFKLGDLVIHATTAHHGATAVRFVVNERSLSECHGGIQRHYAVSAIVQESQYSRRDRPYGGTRELFNETELVAAPPPETELDKAERYLSDIESRAKNIRPEDINPISE